MKMEDVHLSDLMRAIADAFLEMKSKIEAIERTLKDMQSCKKEEKETSNELAKIQPLPLDQTTSGKRILMADTIKVLEQIDNEIVKRRAMKLKINSS